MVLPAHAGMARWQPLRGWISGPIKSCPGALVAMILSRRKVGSSMSLSQDSVIHASGPGPVEALLMGSGVDMWRLTGTGTLPVVSI